MLPQSSFPSATTRLQVLSLVAVWVLGAVPAIGQHSAILEGRVRTDQGQVLPSGVQIRLVALNGEVAAEQPANSDGRFEISGVPGITYRLTVTAPGFQTHEEEVDLSVGGRRILVNIFLSPAPRTKSAVLTSPARTDTGASRKARKEYARGVHALENKQLTAAQAHFERAVTEYPCYARAQMDLAFTFREQRNLARAESALRKAIDCDRDFLEPYNLLGEVLNAQRRFAESESILREGLRRAPSVWQFYYQLAAAHLGRGQFATAEEEYLKVESLNPRPPAQLHVKLADLYLKRNAYAKAYTEMQAYLRADPSGQFAAKIQSIMREMDSSGVLRSPNAEPAAPPSVKP